MSFTKPGIILQYSMEMAFHIASCNLEIPNISGKKIANDSLSRQLAKGTLVRKDLVHDTNDTYVQQLNVREDVD